MDWCAKAYVGTEISAQTKELGKAKPLFRISVPYAGPHGPLRLVLNDVDPAYRSVPLTVHAMSEQPGLRTVLDRCMRAQVAGLGMEYLTGVNMEYVALTVSLIALVLTLWELHAMRTGNALPVLIDLIRDYRTDPVLDAGRRWIRETPEDQRPDPRSGYRDLPPEVVQLSWFLDHLGVLVHRKIVGHEPVAEYLGGSIVQTWEVLCPYLEAERAKDPRWAHYQVYFQILNRRVAKDLYRLRSKALRVATR